MPLILLDFSRAPLEAGSWMAIQENLVRMSADRRSRHGRPLGLWIEGQSLVMQAFAAGIDARQVPDHLIRPELWHSVCQSVAVILTSGQVAQTAHADAQMERMPFLNAAGVYAGPRTDDPMVPAYLYGVVLGVDEVLARDPKPKMPTRSARN